MSINPDAALRRRALATALAAGLAAGAATYAFLRWANSDSGSKDPRVQVGPAAKREPTEEEKEALEAALADRDAEANAPCRIKSLFIYPVKSLKGIEVSSAKLEPEGFEHDRRWMVIDSKGTFMSQRRNARMALVSPRILSGEDGGVVLELSSPTMDHKIQVAVNTNQSAAREEPVRVWDDYITGAFDQGNAAAAWIAQAIRQPGVRLVYMSTSCTRQVSQKHALSEEDRTAFSDGYPYLLISQASLNDLNRRVFERHGELFKGGFLMSRFRPNIVVSGFAPFEEDDLASITVNGATKLCIVKPCARCKITTVDQETGTAPRSLKVEPLLTLRDFRARGDDVMFGQNLIWDISQASDGPVQISVGDPVTKAGKHN